MTPDRWERAKVIFGEAIEMDASHREAFVRDESAGDGELLAEVMSLLDADSTRTIFPSPLAHPAVSGLLKGRYRIERELGQGGLGLVYLARDETLHGRPVVIKMLRPSSAQDAWVSEKFTEEVKALSLIDHPGVAGAIDSGETPEGRRFLVMQYVQGNPLDGMIPPEGVALERAANLLRQIGQALGAAHAKGIWHRDIKPSNIMVEILEGGQEHVRLIDFGIATVSEMPGGELATRAAGTPPYMAPEQLGGRVSAASDIYAMGVIAHELVTGRRPFAAGNLIQLLEQQKAGVTVKPSLLRPGLPLAVERLILQALAYSPQDRPTRAAAFGEELAHALTAAPAPHAGVIRRKAVATGLGAVLLLAAGATAWRQLRHVSAPVRSLTYSVLVQPMLDDRPAGRAEPARLGSTFRPADRFRLSVRAAESGHLYILGAEQGADSLTALFPAPHMYGGSSRLEPETRKEMPEESWYSFDLRPAILELWLVWSEKPVEELEAIRRWANERDRGSIQDASERERIRRLFTEAAAKVPERSDNGVEETVRLAAARVAWKIRLATR